MTPRFDSPSSREGLQPSAWRRARKADSDAPSAIRAMRTMAGRHCPSPGRRSRITPAQGFALRARTNKVGALGQAQGRCGILSGVWSG